ncbi:MAG: omptin family outer membrane protease [Syntrophales bacterium]|nr:omptin family outer membrane protease [Syntrophales bacterium]
MQGYARILILILLMLTLPAASWSAEVNLKEPAEETPWSVEVKVRSYFKSHTSYEFGNPDPPYQSPISRLEFPMDSWWAGAEARRSFKNRFSVGVEVLRNISRETDGVFKDSDWANDADTSRKSIYSESNCRMEPSYNVRGDLDLKISDWLGLPSRIDLRPVVGFRWQRLTFMAHDGSQSAAATNTDPASIVPMPGDVIHFEQVYWQYFLGAKAAIDLGRPLKLKHLSLHAQVDWAYVEGKNEDHHLLREGNRFTYETTYGDARHASIGLKAGLTEQVNLGIDLDYLRIQTTGTHRWSDSAYGVVDASWISGVKVWSEQISATVSLQYAF